MDTAQQNRVPVKWKMPKSSTIFAGTSNLIFLFVFWTAVTTPPRTVTEFLGLGGIAFNAIFMRLCAIHETLRGR